MLLFPCLVVLQTLSSRRGVRTSGFHPFANLSFSSDPSCLNAAATAVFPSRSVHNTFHEEEEEALTGRRRSKPQEVLAHQFGLNFFALRLHAEHQGGFNTQPCSHEELISAPALSIRRHQPRKKEWQRSSKEISNVAEQSKGGTMARYVLTGTCSDLRRGHRLTPHVKNLQTVSTDPTHAHSWGQNHQLMNTPVCLLPPPWLICSSTQTFCLTSCSEDTCTVFLKPCLRSELKNL